MNKTINNEQRAKVLKFNLLEVGKTACLLASEVVLAVFGVACVSDLFEINNRVMIQEAQNKELQNLMGPDFEI